MKWFTKDNYETPKEGDTRVLKYFAFLPTYFYKNGMREWRWLENVEIKQVYKNNHMSLDHAECWEDVEFVD